MNNEKYNQIIDGAYENYVNKNDGVLGRDHLWTLKKEDFINNCTTDDEFSEKWGLRIEERELNRIERIQLGLKVGWKPEGYIENFEHGDLNGWNIPTKLITITYKETIIESYE